MSHITTDVPGLGTKLQVYISAAYVDIPEVSDIEWGDFSVSFRNPNTLASRLVKKRPTTTNLGKITSTLWFDPNDPTHQQLQTWVLTPPSAPIQFKLVYADGQTTPTSVLFEGFIAEFPMAGMTTDDTLNSKFAIEVTDVFTPTPGTP